MRYEKASPNRLALFPDTVTAFVTVAKKGRYNYSLLIRLITRSDSLGPSIKDIGGTSRRNDRPA
jgi:hypothetical protein